MAKDKEVEWRRMRRIIKYIKKVIFRIIRNLIIFRLRDQNSILYILYQNGDRLIIVV